MLVLNQVLTLYYKGLKFKKKIPRVGFEENVFKTRILKNFNKIKYINAPTAIIANTKTPRDAKTSINLPPLKTSAPRATIGKSLKATLMMSAGVNTFHFVPPRPAA